MGQPDGHLPAFPVSPSPIRASRDPKFSMKTYQLQTELWLPRRRTEVFEFFADTGNLEQITPPWLHFRITTQGPIEMRAGALIDYRLRLHGLPIKWRTEITCWDPPRRFVDEQRRGPYRLWIHEHTFAEIDGGTRVVDRVTYAVCLGPLVQRLLVGPDLRRIFDYRKRKLADLLHAPESFTTKSHE